jgi:hypothetical protein
LDSLFDVGGAELGACSDQFASGRVCNRRV